MPQVRVVFDQIVADADDDIRAREAAADVIVGLQAGTAQRHRILERHHTLGHEGIGDGNVELCCEIRQLPPSLARTTPLPARIMGLLGLRNQIGGMYHTVHWVVPATPNSALAAGVSVISILAMFSGNSMKQAPVFSVCASLNALRTTSGMMFGVSRREEYLVIGTEHLLQVQHLMRLLVQADWSGLPGDGHQRRMIHVGIGDAGDQIGGAWSECGQTHAGTPGETAIDIRHERRALFMATGDELDGRIEQCIHEIEVFLAGDTEDVLDAFVLQAFDEQFCGSHEILKSTQDVLPTANDGASHGAAVLSVARSCSISLLAALSIPS